MKRKAALALLLVWTGVVMITAGLSLSAGSGVAHGAINPTQVMRLHVLANSDTEEDQALKRAVRDAILAEVTPLFAEAGSAAKAKEIVRAALPQMEEIAARVVRSWGKSYTVRAEMGRFDFPGKAYGKVFLPAGLYEALRIQIGEAAGANWWCVLWPPMCFVDWSTGVVREPKPGTAGARTVTLPRKALVLIEKDEWEQMEVRARFAVWEWAKERFR
jgi:stage II sporulation protein R